MVWELAIIGVFPALMAFAASMDLITMTIPNRVSLALLVAFLGMAPFAGLTFSDIAVHLGIGLATLVAGILCFARGWIGGGDAKLFAAAALWFGPAHLLEYATVAAVFGGILTLAVLMFRCFPLPGPLARQKWLARIHDAGNGVPYGIALTFGALVVYPNTAWMNAFV